MANGVVHEKAHWRTPSAVEEAHRHGGRAAPRGCVLLIQRKGVSEVLVGWPIKLRCGLPAVKWQREQSRGKGKEVRKPLHTRWSVTGERERVHSAFKSTRDGVL
jgi:hypothetical protein